MMRSLGVVWVHAQYQGKICVVTGAVSRVGQALCGELLKLGATVYMGDVSDQAMISLVDSFNLAHPGRAFALPTDATQPVDAQRLVDKAVARKGKLDYLFMTGAAPCGMPIEQVMDESWRYAIDVNLMGVVRMLEAALPVMRGQGRGGIALVLPLTGVMPAPYEAVCSATHAAARALIESLRYELWDEKICLMSACLDGVFSPAFQLSGSEPAEEAALAVLDGLSRNLPIVVWPDGTGRKVEKCALSSDARQSCLVEDARRRRASLHTKGAYL